MAIGLLLAAGAGRRAGGPKALRRDRDGTSWLRRSVAVLRDGGCAAVTVVLGAEAKRAEKLLPDDVAVVVAPDWAEGIAASLRRGLAALPGQTVCVHLVDLPDVDAAVVRRVLGRNAGPDTLVRASYHRRPGHPVLLGANHTEPLAAGLAGDVGGRAYLSVHKVRLVECGDLARGDDRDEPEPVRA